MKFLLVNLGWPGLVSKRTFKLHISYPPLDLILLANFAAAHGDEATIVDLFVQSEEMLLRAVRDADWIIVATTPYHMWQCPNSDWGWIVEELRKLPREKVILTGLHASVFPEKSLRETGVHAVMKREPEASFCEFLKLKDWRATSGLAHLDGGSFVDNAPVNPLPMEQLCVQNYCVDIDHYRYFLLGRRTGIFESSRGCPWKCTFCDQEMYSWLYRTKPPELFAEEVDRGITTTGMQTAYFFDLEFTVVKKRTIEICEELLKRQVGKRIKWCCQTRADTVSEEVLEALKAAGCSLIHFGVESANPHILKATNKKISLEKITHGVALAKKVGLETACFFMFGLPNEKPEEFETTLDYARSLNPTYASFHFAIPFPGTPLYEQYLVEKGANRGDWPATYFDEWSHDQISDYIRRAYTRFYLYPKRFEARQFRFRLGNIKDKLSYFTSLAR